MFNMADIRQKSTVREFLLDISIYDFYDEIVKKYQLKSNGTNLLLDITDAVIRGEEEISKIPAQIVQIFGVSDDVSKKIASDISGYRLLPLLVYLPGIDSAIENWGGNLSDYPKKRVIKVEDSPEYYIKKLAKDSGLELADHLMKRFIDLSSKYISKERDKATIKKLYLRPMNIGGLGLTDAQADKLIVMLDSIKFSEKKKSELLIKEKKKVEPVELLKKNTVSVPVAKPEPQKKVVHSAPKIVKAIPKLVKDSEISNNIKKGSIDTPLASQMPGELSASAKNIAPIFKKAEVLKVVVPKVAKDTVDKKKMQSKTTIRDERVDKKQTILSKTKVKKDNLSTGFLKSSSSQNKDIENKREELVSSSLKLRKTSAIVPKDSSVQIRKKKEIVGILKKNKKNTKVQKSVIRLPATSIPIISGSTIKKNKKEEIKHKVKKSQKKQKIDLSGNIQDRINQALKPAREISKKNGFKKKDFDAIVDKHLRGVRDPNRTESHLRDKLRLEGGDLQEMMIALELARKVSQGYDLKDEMIANLKSKPIQSNIEKGKKLINERHEAITGSVKEQINPIAPNAQVSASRTKDQELILQAQKIDRQASNKAKESSVLPKVKVRLSDVSQPPRSGDQRQVIDVKYARKLTGPVEEIGTMTATEFRRLSTDPMDASRKLIDRIELLEDESYAMRISGIKAWRKSAVNQLYLSMTTEALEKGISIAEVASMRRNIGDESLSPAEIKSIIWLNEKLKF